MCAEHQADPLLVQEMRELTEMLRSGDGLVGLRRHVSDRRLDPDQVLVAGFIENAQGVVSGGDDVACAAVVTPAGETFYCEWNTRHADAEPLVWREVGDPAKLAEDAFPAVPVALQLAGEAPTPEGPTH